MASRQITKKIPAALRNLHRYGSSALQATKVELPHQDPATATTIPSTLQDLKRAVKKEIKKTYWRKPKVSKRVARTYRKKAIRDGTFGTYDAENGIGWDASWDVGLFAKKRSRDLSASSALDGTDTNDVELLSGANHGNLPWMELRPHKETKRERTREARAKKIEDLLLLADEKILEYRLAQKEKKPLPGIENLIKKMMKASTK